MKSNQVSSFYRFADLPDIDISLDGSSNTIIRLNDMATSEFDMEFDAFELNDPKLTNLISSRYGSLLLSVNTLSEFAGEYINLAFSVMEPGEHLISMKHYIMISQSTFRKERTIAFSTAIRFDLLMNHSNVLLEYAVMWGSIPTSITN